MKVSSSALPDPAESLSSRRGRTGTHVLRPSVAPWLAAALYVALHVPFLAPSLEDIDSINFALGLRDFNPALHQPHPPGYPVYIALGRASLAVVERVSSMDRVAAEAWALAFWSAIGGGVCIVAAWFLFTGIAERLPNSGTSNRNTSGHAAVVIWPTLLLAAAPLFWMTGLRPMSDMPGLALAVGAQALLLRNSDARRLQGALLAGLAAGIRVQTVVLTGPVLLLVLYEVWIRRRHPEGQRSHRFQGRGKGLLISAVAAAAAGCLAWAIPLIVASGGVSSYVAALNTQAAQDFAWVDMLWADPTPRHAAIALYQTLVLPWVSIPLAVAVGVAASLGALVMLVRERRALIVLCISFVPYLVFHLLYQQTDTIRYALPVLPFVAWLAARGVALSRRLTSVVAAPVVAAALIVAVPAGIEYGRDVHPAFRAIADAAQRAAVQPPAALFAHYGVRRPLQAADIGSLRVVDPVVRYEWLGLVDYWRHGGTDPVWFLADRRRTDLALIDPQSRLDVVRYRWAVEQRPELGGTRPLGVDWYRIPPPGWFAGQGWSLTPETGGVAEVTSTGPDHRPIEAWVRRRPGPFHLVVGGRHLGNAGDPDAEIELALDGRPVDRWTLSFKDRNFLRFIELPQGIGEGDTFAALTISSHSADPKRPAPIAIRQFDIQPSGQLIYGFGEGWHEDEFVPETGLRWRWTSERSVLRIEGPPRDVRITLRGESPLHYFDAAPIVKMTASGRTIAELRPAADFEWRVTVPADALTRSNGVIAIETDRVYLPGVAEGTSDDRHLGLRIFECRVEPLFR